MLASFAMEDYLLNTAIYQLLYKNKIMSFSKEITQEENL